jgi:hypothetical protein
MDSAGYLCDEQCYSRREVSARGPLPSALIAQTS